MSRFAASIVCLALSAYALPAGAGVLYRCEAKGGVIAYTNKPDGFPKCKVLSRYADTAPKKAASAAPAPAKTAAPKPRTTTTQRWVYEENPVTKPDFSTVAAGATVDPPEAARASFAKISSGVASTARLVAQEDFSIVLADVASTAPTLGPPLFIAAPYRPRSKPAAPAAATFVAAEPAVKTRIVRGSVYRVQRKDGIVEYTNIRPQGGAFAVLFTYIATCVACDLHSKIDFARTALNLDAYRNEIAAAASDFGIDASLLRAVIHAESAFNPMALSNKGAQGLMQLMPGTANDLGVTDAFDVAQNIRGGARYLSQLLQTFNGDAQLATAAYNAGPGAVQRYRGIPPYDETQVYVQRVSTLRDRYQKAL
ncbi:lytic transglycosylase domain-containing protein [Dokdonella sp.]|uniref:lytic transglycosylase domain-containing protein n=1 Tax=Dokdonella sp. TaxID=2291710 RepID=UPI001B20BE62|nr:lytic transglycosylase domain-containing protein [Dokdonella sp.]MBO9663712.1 lytic transglycosylase domain-containing protein [Dokdonella sp.]